jgi:ADP-heptose:LPS heptosyltransferase
VALGPRLVALRDLGLGDLLTAVPALRALARAHPDHEHLLVAPEPLAPLALQIGWEVVPSQALHRADLAVNLHGRGPQSHRRIAAARPRRAIWFEHRDVPDSRGSPAWGPGEHEVRRWCRLLTESGIPTDPADLRVEPPPGHAPPAAEGATLIHPGAADRARRWPLDRFAAVARAELAQGRRVVVTGSADELPLARELVARAGLPPQALLAGTTDLSDLARAVAGAARVVCGDTGVAHLATAFGTPSVLLFGPTAPGEWGPTSGPHRVLWAGRTGDPHADCPHDGLLEIDVSQTLDALAGL